MTPPTGHAGTPQRHVVHRVAGGYAGVHWDDRQNVVAGHGASDRWRILAALETALEALPRHDDTWRQERDEAVMWMILEVFYDLKRQGRHAWGRGRIGEAVSPRGGTSEPSKLLLNRLDAADIDPRFRHLDLAHEADQLKRRLFRAVFLRGAYVEQSWLVLRVLEVLHVHAGIPVDAGMKEAWRQRLRTRRALDVEVLQAPWTTRSLPEVLAYYGVAKTVKTHRERGYRVRHWHVEALQRLQRRTGTIDLRNLPWMLGRYAWTETK